MKILRPDWIEDSIRGQKRLSLKRYKSVFPALARFNSGEHGNMAVGMDAYNSTNVISLDRSWQLHQPEPGMKDLSVTPSSGGASHTPFATQGSVNEIRTSPTFRQSLSVSATSTSIRRSVTPTPGSAPRSVTPAPRSAPRSVTSTPGSAPRSTIATPRSAPSSVAATPSSIPRAIPVTPGSVPTIALSKSDSEKPYDEDDDEPGEDKERNDIADVDDREEPVFSSPGISWQPSRSNYESLKQEQMSNNSMESIEILVESASPATRSDIVEVTPQTSATKKRRRLPKSLLRSEREPARTHDSQVSEDFFASS
ncbi:hypothetical protein BGZ95_007741 [Linnemannia exigua]|uniref:BRCT domain-containing protein n=1 Tax=Linnemannia exigua TaxID=604196 RepID=A0AAD4DGZ6_9FUNG|nr:hypothetical protein BGZ95_007741 [Linnemannia exigua]